MPRQVVDGLVPHLAVEGHIGDALAIPEERPKRARIDDGAREQVRADLLALLEHGERNLAQPLRNLWLVLEQLSEPDRTRETCGACADDQDSDVDALVRRFARLGDRLPPVERRRKISRANRHDLRCFTSSVSFGRISCRSPTTPRSANSKIGALPSLLIATTVPEPCIPTLCWIAPEMPTAT